MTIPESVTIIGLTWKIKRTKKHNGGSFNASTRIIEVGGTDEEVVFSIFLHEIVEVVYAMLDMRYRSSHDETNSGNIMFAFSHKDFDRATEEIAAILRGLL